MSRGLADLHWLGTCLFGAPNLVASSSLGSLRPPPLIPGQYLSRLVVSNISTSDINSKKWQYFINHLISHFISYFKNAGPLGVTGSSSYSPWAPASGTWAKFICHSLRRTTLGSITEALISLSAVSDNILPYIGKFPSFYK